MNYKVKEKENPFNQAIKCLPPKLKSILDKIPEPKKISTSEIRLRINQPVILRDHEGFNFISADGKTSKIQNKTAVFISKNELTEIFNNICEYSVYSHQEEIKNGFITIEGGHRIGICGTAVKKNGSLVTLKNISSLNIRIAREINGASMTLLKNITENDFGILIVGPPSSGKTTILRDLARVLSFDLKKCVTIVDERCEIAATYNGISSNDVGFCDVMNEYPKGEGIIQAIRTMSPEIIVCDEIGSVSDTDAIRQGLNAGVKIVASIHADSIESFLSRTQAIELIKTNAFKKIVFLENNKSPGQIKEIIGVDDIDVKNNRINRNHHVWDNHRLALCP